MKSENWVKKTGFVATLAVCGLWGMGQATANVVMTDLGEACPGTCVDLASSGLDATGGGIVDPAASVDGQYKTPGEDTGNSGNVASYNVTSSLNSPEGATIAIEVTGLDNFFDFYWGSVDSYNILTFWSGDIGTSTSFSYDGDDLVSDLGLGGSGPNYNFDRYVSFTGNGDFSFSALVLSSTNGVAFELARSVPAPGALGLLGVGLLGLGFAGRRRSN